MEEKPFQFIENCCSLLGIERGYRRQLAHTEIYRKVYRATCDVAREPNVERWFKKKERKPGKRFTGLSIRSLGTPLSNESRASTR